jgi:hypothetical protein
MLKPMAASRVLDREYLEMRAKILELAASLDRLDRGEGSVKDDRRLTLLQQGLEILKTQGSNRAEKVQQLFSREFDENWQETFGLKAMATKPR